MENKSSVNLALLTTGEGSNPGFGQLAMITETKYQHSPAVIRSLVRKSYTSSEEKFLSLSSSSTTKSSSSKAKSPPSSFYFLSLPTKNFSIQRIAATSKLN